MKRFIPLAIIALLTAVNLSAQTYETSPDPRTGGKTFKGILSRQILESDTSFTRLWYTANFKAYAPPAEAVSALQQHKDTIRLVAFMGTWCEDSQFIIPKFFSLLDAAGVSKDRVTVLGTDRDKKTLGNLSEALNVTLVPTIIVLQNGKELGRVVEYGKNGQWDKELGQIVATAK
ncbi:MAG TPA: thioredoxin family protein [Chitinophagaceae bacterium]|jgi:thiol-disulfide isomerase/thioredoxin|nr:thioredoxin family protein [Chitinophagaceae bacterium]